MAAEHKVEQGECISSIAFEHGFSPDTLWNHPGNAELKNQRKNPNVLAPGDVVFIPDLRPRKEKGATDAVHKFRFRGVPAKLRLELFDDDEPLANQPYTLELDNGRKLRGTTTGAGKIETSIPPDAHSGELTVGVGEEAHVFKLRLGYLNPVDTKTGLQSRLENLGYEGELKEMLRQFQRDQQLPDSGDADDDTRSQLQSIHGS